MKNIFDVLFSKLPLTTIKAKFVLAFSLYFLFVLLIIFAFYWFDNQKTKFNQITVILYQINNNLKKADNAGNDFFSHENINPEFYKSDGKSSYILKYKAIFKKIQNDLQLLKSSPQIIENEVDNEINALNTLLYRYNNIFDSLTYLQKIRGFKDYGLEGKMRNFIHKLEDKKYSISQIKLLTIRRHEKDFLLRKEVVYVERWRAVISEVIKDVSLQKNNNLREETLLLLNNYKATFLELTSIEQKIGYNNDNGLREEMSKFSVSAERELNEINKKILSRIEELIQHIQLQILALIIFCIVLNILLAFTVYRKLSRPIKYLSQSIQEIIRSNLDEKVKLYEYEANDEIGALAQDFKFMLNSLRVQTKELQIINAELLQQKEEIITQHDNIETFSKQIVKINNDMTASINYAKRIQNALLSFEKKMDGALPDNYFVLFKPKDIVSGDFYWFAEKGDDIVIAAVDCTGHGVPGAFMSVIGNTLLKQIVHDRGIRSPHLILSALHKGVWQTLQLENSEIKDGMDISLCLINRKDKLLSFAGARHPLFMIQDGNCQIIKSNKISIGENADYSYTQHTFSLDTTTTFYLFSDGYADQFGGAMDKKFTIRQLKELLLAIHLEDMSVQKTILTDALEKWQGHQKQTDDILLIGVRTTH
jgi:serine phosphatase RsbU (regulator of sigma subunit)